MAELALHLLDPRRGGDSGFGNDLLLDQRNLPPERRQPFHIRTTIGNFAALFRHKRVLSYMLASGFSFAGMFSFLSAGPFVYIEINHVAPENFGYYFALNIVFLFVMTILTAASSAVLAR